jgi:outer membrane protein TolC
MVRKRKPFVCIPIKPLIVLIGAVLSLFASDARADKPTLEQLVDEALQNNSEIAAARAVWEQFEYKIPQVNSLDDPMLSFAFSNYPTDTYSSDDFPMTGNEFRIAQKFPFPGKLNAREDLAREKAAWYQAVYLETRYKIARNVKDAWYRLYFQDRAIGVVERNLTLIDQVISLTETRYEVGQGLQQDVLKAHVERSRLLEKLISLSQQREAALADLNKQLNRRTSTPLTTPEDLDWLDSEPSLEDLQGAAEHERPIYHAYRSLVNRFRAERRLAELDYKPDFTLWAGYRFRDDNLPDGGRDFVSAGISINLPIYRAKRDAAAAEADAGIRTAQRQLDDFRNQVDFKIHESFSQMEQSREQARLYRDGLVPQATQNFNAAMSAYQVGKVEFLSLLDALMRLYNYEIDYYRFQSQYLRSVANLEAETGLFLLGEELPAAESKLAE